jgi:hypothetical protein
MDPCPVTAGGLTTGSSFSTGGFVTASCPDGRRTGRLAAAASLEFGPGTDRGESDRVESEMGLLTRPPRRRGAREGEG